MKQNSETSYHMDEGEMFSSFNGGWVHGPADVELSISNGTLYAQVEGVKYEVDAAKFSQFPDLIRPIESHVNITDNTRTRDASQDGLDWVKEAQKPKED